MIFVLYLVLAALVVGISIKISYYVDLIDKTTKISGAFIGGVMLAAVTSLPELFTSMSATMILGKPELVIGNILGSNIFNITILSVIVIIMRKKINHSYISKSHLTVAAWIIACYCLLMFPMWLEKDIRIFTVSIISLAIGVIYILSIRSMASDTCEDNECLETDSPLTSKQLFTRFALFSVLLVVASIGITYTSDLIAIKLGLDVTLAGALLLGIATSLPELASCITLAKIGNLNAVVGNVLGSNIFNLFILLLADLSFVGGSIYLSNPQSQSLVFFGIISTISSFAILLAYKYREKLASKANNAIYLGGSFISIMGYVLFLVLS